MSEKFSPTLRIGDLSDFIAPSQACVVSLKGLKTTTPNTRKRGKPEVFLQVLEFIFSRLVLTELKVFNFVKNFAFLSENIDFCFLCFCFKGCYC
jgi:hypothetical protein